MAEGASVDNPYVPFTSELDWRVAQWAVKETVGNSAFDRLLEIPEVHSFCYSLPHLNLSTRWLKGWDSHSTMSAAYTK
jgi:hypothetical protein